MGKVIAPFLKAMKEANDILSLSDFVDVLYKTHPPKSGRLAPERSCRTSKRLLLETIREYSPSGQAQYFDRCAVPREWELLCSEIQKLLNGRYEADFKEAAAQSESP